MTNTQSNTDIQHNSNYHDSLDYSKPKPKTATFTIDTIEGINCRGPNLRDRGNDANNEHPSPSSNTKNQSSNFDDSRNDSIPARTGKATMEISWKPGGSQFTKCRIHSKLDNMGTKQAQIDRARILGYGTK